MGNEKRTILFGDQRCKRAIVEVEDRNVGKRSNQAI